MLASGQLYGFCCEFDASLCLLVVPSKQPVWCATPHTLQQRDGWRPTLPNREEKVPVRSEWKMMMVSSRSHINTRCGEKNRHVIITLWMFLCVRVRWRKKNITQKCWSFSQLWAGVYLYIGVQGWSGVTDSFPPPELPVRPPSSWDPLLFTWCGWAGRWVVLS